MIATLDHLFPEKGITTYSFRKMFAERKFQEYDDPERVATAMGHKNKRIPGAHYLTFREPRQWAEIGCNPQGDENDSDEEA